MKKISVIVPVYQAGGHLDACVESIRRQSDGKWELLLVDDASTDGSGEKCDALAATDTRIRVIHMAHGGAAAARNRGIREADGELIAFIDSDDYVEPTYLAYLRGLKKAYHADIAVCAHDMPPAYPYRSQHWSRPLETSTLPHAEPAPQTALTPASSADRVPPRQAGECFRGDDTLKALLYQRHFMSVPWGMLCEKALWQRVPFPEGTEAEDMGTIYRLFMEADCVVWGEAKLYHYVQHGANTVYTTKKTRRIAYYTHSRQMVSVVRRIRPACAKAALCRHFSICAQALSESGLRGMSRFRRRLYADLKKLSPVVLRDPDARLRNRGAAGIALFSPALLHLLLRIQHMSKLWRMNYGSNHA